MIHLRKTEEISEIKNKDNSQIQQKKDHIILEKNFVRFANTKATL